MIPLGWLAKWVYERTGWYADTPIALLNGWLTMVIGVPYALIRIARDGGKPQDTADVQRAFKAARAAQLREQARQIEPDLPKDGTKPAG